MYLCGGRSKIIRKRRKSCRTSACGGEDNDEESGQRNGGCGNTSR